MKRYIWGLLIVFFILFSFSPTLYEISKKDTLSGRTFELIHNYITDYNFYLSRIREGMEGRWTVVERYTSEPHTGSLVQIFYLLLGKVDNHAPTVFLGVTGAYHIARIILGALILIFIALWVRTLFPSFLWQIMAFLVVVTASVWPHIVVVGEGLRFGGPMSWWTLMDNLQRMTFLPHLLIGQSLLLFLLLSGSDETTLTRPGNWVFLGILAFVLGMIFPPGLVFLGASYGVMILLSLLSHWKDMKKNKESWITTHILSRAMIGIISFPSFLYFSLMFGVYPWKRLVELDILHPLPFQFPEYIQALGPTLPLGILGLLLVVIRKDQKFIGSVSWVIAWLICLFVFQYIPQQSPLRFSEMLPHVPLGILTVYVFYTLYQRATVGASSALSFAEKISRSAARNMLWSDSTPHAKLGKRTSKFFPLIARSMLSIVSFSVPLFLITIGLLVMVSSFLWQKDFVDQKVAAGWPAIYMNNVIVYPVTGFVDALVYLEKNTPKDTVILSDMTAGNYIPPYIGRTVYVGHNNTVNLEAKLEEVHTFFRGVKPDAYSWMKNNGIGYVFFGPQEKESGSIKNLKAVYPFLQEVYTNADVTVFAVQ